MINQIVYSIFWAPTTLGSLGCSQVVYIPACRYEFELCKQYPLRIQRHLLKPLRIVHVEDGMTYTDQFVG